MNQRKNLIEKAAKINFFYSSCIAVFLTVATILDRAQNHGIIHITDSIWWPTYGFGELLVGISTLYVLLSSALSLILLISSIWLGKRSCYYALSTLIVLLIGYLMLVTFGLCHHNASGYESFQDIMC